MDSSLELLMAPGTKVPAQSSSHQGSIAVQPLAKSSFSADEYVYNLRNLGIYRESGNIQG